MFLKHTKWAIIWALFILILCAIPGRDLPRISALELLNFDKFVHASLFFVLIVLTIRGFKVQTYFNLLHQFSKSSALLICIAYGGLLELMQGSLFKERSADVFDFIANSSGCIIGLLIYNSIEAKLLKKIIN
jgi:glycopeptide antibiotics resistance protein